MSWKLYSIGTLSSASTIAQYAAEKLRAIGYEATQSGSKLQLTADGKQYELTVYAPTSGSYPYYLWVNAESGDILISPINGSASYQGCNMGYMVCAGIMHVTSIVNGEPKVFVFTSPSWTSGNVSNTNIPDPGEGYMTLQRGIFNSHISTLYWGSKAHTTGVVIEVGSDKFVCLSAFLYAKL